MKKVYIVWAWWIWVSWIARYYRENWYKVFWSDKFDSDLILKLKEEWIEIEIWVFPERLDNSFSKLIYTEAVKTSQEEIKKAIKLWIKIQTYPEALAEVANKKKLIAIAWTHWKSTTTSMASIMLKDSPLKINTLVWTILKEFWQKNTYFSDSEYFSIEACEYQRSFLKYNPYITIITNIDLDHLDYYKDLEDYISAFKEFIWNMISGWYVIIDWNSKNSLELEKVRNDLNFVKIFDDYFVLNSEKIMFEEFNLQIPGEHIKYDAKLVYALWKILDLKTSEVIKSLESYSWVWRRMETVKITAHNNKIMSDYGHHPEEIIPTLKAIKEGFKPEKLIVCFQPHQYSRTLELLEQFKNSFKNADVLIVPDIYESRDSKEDMEKINGEKFCDLINHNNKIFWNWLKNTGEILKDLDSKNKNSIILLLWAWDVDNLRKIFN